MSSSLSKIFNPFRHRACDSSKAPGIVGELGWPVVKLSGLKAERHSRIWARSGSSLLSREAVPLNSFQNLAVSVYR